MREFGKGLETIHRAAAWGGPIVAHFQPVSQRDTPPQAERPRWVPVSTEVEDVMRSRFPQVEPSVITDVVAKLPGSN